MFALMCQAACREWQAACRGWMEIRRDFDRSFEAVVLFSMLGFVLTMAFLP
jgi:hypothetical protein